MESLGGKILMGIIRHMLVGFSAIYVSQGIINNDQQQTLVSGLMVAVGIGLSIYDKTSQHSKGA